jgi:(1->4)-alpha-D-glucan 1-alpha-D-glucosylmutase
MHIPKATYRIQLGPGFGFEELRKIVPYLAGLGISHIYASPVFEARRGSTHGYDITDPNAINPEIGTREDLEKLAADLNAMDMYWLQDIVPNHMAYDCGNAMLMDVLEFGENSPFFGFFDIDWTDPVTGQRSPLLAPFLARFYDECLESGEITLVWDNQGLGIRYRDIRFPVRIDTYPVVLEEAGRLLRADVETEDPSAGSFDYIINTLRSFDTLDAVERRYSSACKAKQDLLDFMEGQPEARARIDTVIARFNGTPGDIGSFDLLDELLSMQTFRLACWKVAAEEINYRRFAAVNRLISLRMETEQVFDHYHRLIIELVGSGVVSGLRIDHVDGLYDPTGYLEKLRRKTGDAYIVVEKILGPDESLPAWPVSGTTGYDFLNQVNGVLCETRNAGRVGRIYSHFIGMSTHYEDLVHRKKRLMTDMHMPEVTEGLAASARLISRRLRRGRDMTLHGLRHCIAELMASFPVYRTYVDAAGVSEADVGVVNEAVNRAIKRNPGHAHELNFLRSLLLLDYDGSLPAGLADQILHFVMRFQNFTGPITAKGFEDTVLYLYNRHLALNEVGGSPDRFGVTLDAFHDFNRQRQKTWPHSMSATSTHDTKRGEDVRARLNVLSEIPNEWERRVRAWRLLNGPKKLYLDGTRVPDRNDEYFLYQTLIGAFPFEEGERPAFTKRLRAYLVKAVREAKIHTAWLEPDSEYENAFILFVEKLLEPGSTNEFLADFLPFQRRVAHYGILNSLAQTLLKLTAPGVPDVYQGSEFWDLSLVDPDNRRPVDFERRAASLEQLRASACNDISRTVADLRASKEDGRIKQFLIHRILGVRSSMPGVFDRGGYRPLGATGAHGRHIIAFAREHGNGYAIAIAPRFFTILVKDGEWPHGGAVWKDTRIAVPDGFPGIWKDAVTDGVVHADGGILVGDVLREFPSALIVSEAE